MTWASTLEVLPGLVGEVARWIDSTLNRSQPGISIPIALSFVAALKGKRYEPFEGAYVNLYTCAIAPSGSGKTQAQNAIYQLIEKSGLPHRFIMGEPASDSGVLRALQDESRRFLIWDEFGQALRELASSTSSHRMLILQLLMKLFSATGALYIGKEYAEREQVTIKEPYLSIFASSTAEVFFDSINRNFLHDGFLPRWLIFFSDFNDKEQVRRSIQDIPPELIEKIQYFENWEPGHKGNLDAVLGQTRKKLRYNQEDFKEQKEISYNASMPENEEERVIYSRVIEQAAKLCVVLCDGDHISSDIMRMAFWLAQKPAKEMLERCNQHLSESHSRNERDKQKIRERFVGLIKPGERVSARDLYRRCYFLMSAAERYATIKELCDVGIWDKIEEKTGQRRTTFYTLNNES
jgi:hypothetical protein